MPTQRMLRWVPGLASSVLSLEAKASNNARNGLAVDVLFVPREQELDRDGDPPRSLDQCLVHEEPATEDGGCDPGFGRRQRDSDRGAQRHAAPVADRRQTGGYAPESALYPAH